MSHVGFLLETMTGEYTWILEFVYFVTCCGVPMPKHLSCWLAVFDRSCSATAEIKRDRIRDSVTFDVVWIRYLG